MNKKIFSIGASASASWAWGTSLIMGQQIAQEKGLIAWIIWAVCNTLTLALFGWLYNKKMITPDTYNIKWVKTIALVIQLFCLLVQLNFINQQFLKITGNATLSYIITIATGVFFTLIVFKKGLPTSIKTDIVQWLIAIGSIIAIICVGLVTDVPKQVFASTTTSGIMWGVWSGLILLAGLIGDVQHWQRAEADESGKSYYLGAVLFGMYMLLILGMAFFEFSKPMNIILLVAVLCITTSTIDSIAVALHELGDKKIGTGIALLMCVVWGLFVEMGMIALWSSFGVIRFAFAVAILLLPFCKKGNAKISIPFTLISLATIVYFAITKQIAINSVIGVACFMVAVAILGYLIYETIKSKKEFY